MIDCLWSKDPNVLRQIFKKSVLKVVNRSVDRYVVWASREIKAFSQTFGLPEEKFVFVPYHTTFAERPDIETYDGDYIFSGGNSNRDYDTLVQAVKDLPVKLFIASTSPNVSSSTTIPENVEIRGCSHKEYSTKMAGCRINVVALQPGELRSAGQQTFLNSMWLGKPTIVTDPEGAVDYINHGEDGLLVCPKDPVALREAIQFLLNNPEKMRKIGIKAAQRARKYSTEEHFKEIVSIVHEVVDERRNHKKEKQFVGIEPS
jgi:glycosyltransferase involved in cell wall biosynthesis